MNRRSSLPRPLLGIFAACFAIETILLVVVGFDLLAKFTTKADGPARRRYHLQQKEIDHERV